jgi:predicted small lipoprotein YifL
MKKIIACLLALVLLLMIAGCGNNTGNTTPPSGNNPPSPSPAISDIPVNPYKGYDHMMEHNTPSGLIFAFGLEQLTDNINRRRFDGYEPLDYSKWSLGNTESGFKGYSLDYFYQNALVAVFVAQVEARTGYVYQIEVVTDSLTHLWTVIELAIYGHDPNLSRQDADKITSALFNHNYEFSYKNTYFNIFSPQNGMMQLRIMPTSDEKLREFGLGTLDVAESTPTTPSLAPSPEPTPFPMINTWTGTHNGFTVTIDITEWSEPTATGTLTIVDTARNDTNISDFEANMDYDGVCYFITNEDSGRFSFDNRQTMTLHIISFYIGDEFTMTLNVSDGVATSTPPSVPSPAPEPSVDYSAYKGAWSGTGTNIDGDNLSYRLRINSTTDTVVTGELTVSQGFVIALINFSSTKVNEDIFEYQFDCDDRGNGGTLRLVLDDDAIQVFVIVNDYSTARFDYVKYSEDGVGLSR